MDTTMDSPPRLETAPSRAADVLICVVGTAEVMRNSEDELQVLAADRGVHRLDWRLDDEFGEPPVEAAQVAGQSTASTTTRAWWSTSARSSSGTSATRST